MNKTSSGNWSFYVALTELSSGLMSLCLHGAVGKWAF